MTTTKIPRACGIAAVLVVLAFAIGCGNNAAKVVIAPKPAADERSASSTQTTNDAPLSRPDASYTAPRTQPAPEPKAAKWTKPQFDKIKLGMTPDQCKEILGSAMFESGNGKSLNIQWAEPDVSQTIQVVFENGKALHKTAAGLGPIKEKITQANLDKIRTGTPEVSVFEILGPGTSESEMSNGKALTWEANGLNVLIQLEKGKVVNKMVFKN